jgi:hypothetical protein
MDPEIKVQTDNPAAATDGPQRAFRDYTIDNFDPVEVAKQLVSGRGFPGEKQILFAGLCAWVVSARAAVGEGSDPQHKNLINGAMIRAMAEFMDHRQPSIDDPKVQNTEFRRGLYLFADKSLAQLVEVAFGPFGGFLGLLNALSEAQLSEGFARLSVGIERVRTLMSVFHAYSIMLDTDDGKLPRMNPNLGAKLAGEIFASRTHLGSDAAKSNQLEPMRRTIVSSWKAHESSAALIYAASLQTFDGATLLDKMCAKAPMYEKATLLDWFQLERLVQFQVLANISFRKNSVPPFLRLPAPFDPAADSERRLPVPALDSDELEWLKRRLRGSGTTLAQFRSMPPK